jgi:hypothetical protein
MHENRVRISISIFYFCFEYLREFEAEIKITSARESDAQGLLFNEKTRETVVLCSDYTHNFSVNS